jgi:hypothetical protein
LGPARPKPKLHHRSCIVECCKINPERALA